ncbi:MAG: diaminopimelate decarboxylase [Candidatus Omnitrophica bacterium]|nr:diaminopimelate decarboxylase [Candidatus Omnitrophota bacterium]
MHDFKVRNGQLYCERVAVDRIADAIGTPVYVYSRHTLIDHFQKLRRAFHRMRPLICFSVKANGSLAILKMLVSQGAGLDIVSGGELYKARRAGCPANRIVYASVGKSRDEIREALRAGIFCFNVESLPELDAINEEAVRLRTKAPVALRINPDVEAHTHRYITTGTAESKFGIQLEQAERLISARGSAFGSTRLLGFHLHIGSQITRSAPFIQAIRRVGNLISRLRKRGIAIEWLNLGGGLGIVYKDERPQTAQAFAEAVVPHLLPLKVKLILEPGRFIVGNAGILVTQVLYRKETPGKRFLVVDAGMSDLIRPALYGAYHEVVPVISDKRQGTSDKRQAYDVVGPICESADVLAKDRRLPALGEGERLAIFGAGAYGFVMASNYNGRRRPAEVLVRGSRWFLIRHRETLNDLVRHETVPSGLLT